MIESMEPLEPQRGDSIPHREGSMQESKRGTSLRVIGFLMSVGGTAGCAISAGTGASDAAIGLSGLAVPIGLLLYGLGRMLDSL